MNSVADVKKFIHFAAKKLGLTSLPKINLVGSSEDNKNAFGHFFSDRNKTTITVRIVGRHPIDIMRTIAHELIHYKQKISGVRKSEQMREDEANALAGRIMRDYDTTNPGAFKDLPVIKNQVHEDMGVAAIGGAVNNIGDKQIATIDPLLMKSKKKMTQILKRKTPPITEIKEGNGIFHKKSLFSDAGHKKKPMKDRFGKSNHGDFSHNAIKGEEDEEKSDYTPAFKGKKIVVGD
jgi:hypothetical protein